MNLKLYFFKTLTWQNGYLEIVECLLDKGANIEQGNGLSQTAIWIAAVGVIASSFALCLRHRSVCFVHLTKNALIICVGKWSSCSCQILAEEGRQHWRRRLGRCHSSWLSLSSMFFCLFLLLFVCLCTNCDFHIENRTETRNLSISWWKMAPLSIKSTRKVFVWFAKYDRLDWADV